MSQSRRDRRRRTLLGVFVSTVVALFVFGLLQADAVREWLNPSKELRLVLPDEGLFGLSEGAKIEVLGTPAGKVTAIVIDPSEKIHATAQITPSMAPFIRRDSKAIIRKTFGVAGDSYLEITRGFGEEMDWDYAVLTATADRAPTESIGEMMEDVRSRVMPILVQTERAIKALADLTESLANPEGHLQVMLTDISSLTTRIAQGEGSLGRLLANDATAREFETLMGNANKTVASLGPILEEVQTTTEQIALLSTSINAQSKDLPQINAKVNAILSSLEGIMRDLRATSPELPKITRDISASTASVPVLMGMTQQTLAELESLLRQLRNSWLLGGGGDGQIGGGRLPPREVRP
ncbi:MAG: MlaD family protein [Chromatiaceae bacterium]|nr:MlaD family protein [Chromatiaceae bacterium]